MKKSLIATLGLAAIASLGFASHSWAGPLAIDLGTFAAGDTGAEAGGHLNAPKVYKFETSAIEYLQLSATVSNGSLLLDETHLALANSGRTTLDFVSFTDGSGSWTANIGSVGLGYELLPGTYYFTITPFEGAGAGTNSVGYSYNVNGVPEISTWTMLLAGFGALGFAGYRRKAETFAG